MSTHFNNSGLEPLPPRADGGKKPWYRNKWVPLAGVGVLGIMIGASLAGPREDTGNTPVPAASPTATVTRVPVSDTPSPAPTVTKTVEVTPAACLKALDLSEQGFTYSAEAMGYMSDALTAASKFDVAAMQEANAGLDRLNPKMKELTAPMKAAATECRAGAK